MSATEKITPDMVREFLNDLIERNSFGEVTLVMRDGLIEQIRQNLTHKPSEFSEAYQDRSTRRHKVFVIQNKKATE